MSKMEKGVSVERQIKHAEDWHRRHYALEEECEDCLAILFSLRELVLLRDVAKHSDMFLKARRFMDRDQQRMSLEELERTLSAYEARPK